jgi:hypothetical protein
VDENPSNSAWEMGPSTKAHWRSPWRNSGDEQLSIGRHLVVRWVESQASLTRPRGLSTKTWGPCRTVRQGNNLDPRRSHPAYVTPPVPAQVVSPMSSYVTLYTLPDMDFLASPDTRWSEVLFQSSPDVTPGPLFHAHQVVNNEPLEQSMCDLYRSEGPFVPWEPSLGFRCRRCEAAIDKL